MTKHLISPYTPEKLPWLRGNLHAHTTNSDGDFSPAKVLRRYAALGYDFLMISDHDVFTDPASLDPLGMVLLPGYEVTAGGPHMLHVNASTLLEPVPDRQKVIEGILEDGGFCVVNHPNWEDDFNHCPQGLLESWRGYAGIEIYNGVIRCLTGTPLATDRWDRLLGAGRRIWGFANDDSHKEGDYGIAWNMVQSASREPEAILAALAAGRFYASTGVEIRHIGASDNTIRVSTVNAQRIIVYTDFGHRAAMVDGTELTFDVPPGIQPRYYRVECWGAGETMAWTQPFFVEDGSV